MVQPLKLTFKIKQGTLTRGSAKNKNKKNTWIKEKKTVSSIIKMVESVSARVME